MFGTIRLVVAGGCEGELDCRRRELRNLLRRGIVYAVCRCDFLESIFLISPSRMIDITSLTPTHHNTKFEQQRHQTTQKKKILNFHVFISCCLQQTHHPTTSVSTKGTMHLAFRQAFGPPLLSLNSPNAAFAIHLSVRFCERKQELPAHVHITPLLIKMLCPTTRYYPNSLIRPSIMTPVINNPKTNAVP